jgi:hypothetical protein
VQTFKKDYFPFFFLFFFFHYFYIIYTIIQYGHKKEGFIKGKQSCLERAKMKKNLFFLFGIDEINEFFFYFVILIIKRLLSWAIVGKKERK